MRHRGIIDFHILISRQYIVYMIFKNNFLYTISLCESQKTKWAVIYFVVNTTQRRVKGLDYPHLCFHKYSFGFPYYSTVCVAIPVLRNSKESSWNLLLGCFHGSFKTVFKCQLPTEGVFKVTPPCVLTLWSTYLVFFFFFLVSFSIDVFKSDICWLTPPSWSIVY